MQITNNATSTRTLPTGLEVKPGATVDVSDADWKACAGHPVVLAWIKAGDIKTGGKAADKTGGKVDPLA